MKIIGQLTLQQQLELQVIEGQSKRLSLEQTQEYAVEIMRQIMIKDNLVDYLLATADEFADRQPRKRIRRGNRHLTTRRP